MKRYTPDELAEVLHLHQLWLRDKEGGVRANLVRANLYGANLYGANLDGAKGFQPFLCIGPIGSRNGYTTAYLREDKVRCGCFTGTLQAFEGQVRRTHANNPVHLAGYLALVEMVKVARAALPPAPAEEEKAPAPFAQRDQVQLTEDARKVWPWAPEVPGKVMNCADGWTHIDYPTCYLSVPDSFLERFPVPALVAEKEGV